ncbi:Gfo/Idh/MocA family protein [Sporohalobacter salinus]|uniref:Gfo/Idh/MocA family protein n=1 Tax=Sporohalobacter salinus TaxID=1494606 RepID=UPI001961794B|nr:Gfo/Idh/MocA family oxidoreductase [Sporohalobacter salinus]MBM7622974.1 putative dehydrogenase [Sporohalobacter salinus]
MEFLVIGLGSMGKRRIRLLKNNFKNIKIVGVDKKEDRRNESEKKYNISTYKTIEKAVKNNNLTAGIVCTSPLSHANIIKICFSHELHVFTEINLVKDEYEDIIEASKNKGLELFLSSTMIYRKELDYIYKKVENEEQKVNYRYHVGQYLPDWHPWEDYNDFFVENKRTNGCRELFAIELPWIIRTFGEIEEIKCFKDKISELNIEYPDIYSVLLKHKDGHIGNINMDIVSRKAIRNLEVYSENMHLFWDGTPTGLEEYNFESEEMKNIDTYKNIDQNNNYASNIIENVYLDELKIFIDKIKGQNNEKYTFEDDLYTLSIIDQIEGNI